MTIVVIVLVLLLAVVVSSVVARMLPVPVPIPLVQIAIGVAIGATVDLRVRLDPELFLLLFLPPLLFLDAWRIPKDELRKDFATVVELSLGLVLLTVIGVGLFVHWLIPAVPLGVAFALAAVISPTDPIAVSSIAARIAVPRRMLRILEGESLLNDASGLVCLRFAVAAVLTGSFSPVEAGMTFLWLVAGGLAVGAGVTLVAMRLTGWVAARHGEDAGTQILVTILVPFAAYLAAEHIHCSGLLAAVAAGVAMSIVQSPASGAPATRMRGHSIWDMIHFALNGTIFVLLGEQLTLIVHLIGPTAAMAGQGDPWWLTLYVAAIVAMLAGLRFVWTWTSFRIGIARHPERYPFRYPPWRLIAAMAVSGVRGAVTLAGVLTIPLTLADGSPFPGRQFAVFVATAVIIVSLILASVLLPWLVRGLSLPDTAADIAAEDSARIAAIDAAIAAIERDVARADDPATGLAADRITTEYRERRRRIEQEPPDRATQHRTGQVERTLRLTGIRAERDTVSRLTRERRIGNALGQAMLVELDVAELHHGR